MRAEKLKIRCDSRLVVGQVTGEFEANEDRMRRYRDVVLQLLGQLAHHEVLQVPREQNIDADMLSKLGQGTPEHVSKIARVEDLARSSLEAYPVLPVQIITDNGRQFESKEFSEFCAQWRITHTRVAVSYPQANGQVENVNRTIVDGLQKNLESAKGAWVEELDVVLWTYRTTPRRATGETPFSLSYGFEARAPAEVAIPPYRAQVYDPDMNEDNHKIELHLIDEKRETATTR
ncbi:PREDICTED: uncharacterized protein LOC109169560 [Ipomoea nil]|uniref:uncharacterized protein LOC109169560 n=1 Tax=Ipomoea nil TaxID=35883 RepID=UPI000900B064|nr:PREDICTED: uncharacterized protein LOC109169560 [Ipomoea nil]